jgi:methylated-DNA-[protein]-cysteine S-methyltransferase
MTPAPAYTYTDTPIGTAMLVGRDGRLSGLYLGQGRITPDPAPDWRRDDTHLDDVKRQLDEYFAGERTVFDVAVELPGSSFQMAVWSALADIPYGRITTYGAIAAEIGHPTSARAVGGASGRNPVSIIIPCHRVVGADGSLTGYGWGIERKAWLLGLEQQRAGSDSRRSARVRPAERRTVPAGAIAGGRAPRHRPSQ